MLLLVLLFLSTALLPIYAIPQNITIDDTYGDALTGNVPTYLPSGGWALGQQCTGCGLQPDRTRVVKGSWHDTTHHHATDDGRSVQFSFTGTALTVYCIVANPSDPTLTSAYDLQFLLDGSSSGTFSHSSDGSNQFIYNVPVFTISNLANATHDFTMVANSSSVDSVILFDFASYIYDDGLTPTLQTPAPSASVTSGADDGPAPPTSTAVNFQKHLGAILGGVIGGLAFIISFICLFIFLRRRRMRHHFNLPTVRPSPLAPLIVSGTSSSASSFLFGTGSKKTSANPTAISPFVLPPQATLRQTDEGRMTSRSVTFPDRAWMKEGYQHKRNLSSATTSDSAFSYLSQTTRSTEVNRLRREVADLRTQMMANVNSQRQASPVIRSGGT